jgi:cellobiose-specific phosphotransferase system component IIA
MKPDKYAFLLTLLVLANPALLHAEEEDHDKKALEHLEKAIRSGKEGNVKGISSHTEEGKKELIEANKEHPYTNLQKPIYGEHEKAEHDKEAFEEMDEAISEAREGHVEEAVEAVERASTHLKEKIDSR